ncbi:MAG: 60S ribosomal export protein NMD3 [Candidatus Hodarchaeota archaeon]
MELFCAKCGTELTKEGYFHGLCQSCYEEEHPLFQIKKPSEIKMCAQCLSSLSKGQWVDPATQNDKEAIAEAITKSTPFLVKPAAKISYLKVIPHLNEAKQERKNHLIVPITVVGKGKSDPHMSSYTVQRNALVNVYFTVCERCKSIRQSKYAAVLQVRAKGRKVAEKERKALLSILDDVMQRIPKDRMAFYEIKEQKKGFNINFGSLSAARKVVLGIKNSFGGISRESRKLVGVDKSGKRISRTVIALRLPSFTTNDILIIKGLPNQVMSIRGDKVGCINLGSFRHVSYPLTKVWKAELLNKEEIKTFLVLTILPDTVQLMDTRYFHTFEVSKPPWDIGISQEIGGIVVNNRIYLLPPENYLKDANSPED